MVLVLPLVAVVKVMYLGEMVLAALQAYLQEPPMAVVMAVLVVLTQRTMVVQVAVVLVVTQVMVELAHHR